MEDKFKVCSNCGTELNIEATQCYNCGNRDFENEAREEEVSPSQTEEVDNGGSEESNSVDGEDNSGESADKE